MVELAPYQFEVESMDKKLLDSIQEAIKSELEEDELDSVSIDIHNRPGILPAPILVIITIMATAAAKPVGEKIGEIIAEEIDRYYRKKRGSGETDEDDTGVSVTTKETVIPSE